MPGPADLKKSAYLRALVLGEPFVGKTQTCIQSAEGPVFIIAADGESNLQPAARVRDDFTYELVTGDKPNLLMARMSSVVSQAIQGAREGKWKTIFLDTITSYAEALEIGFEDAKNGTEDHGKSTRKYHHNIASTIERLKMAPCHLVVLAHYIELEGGIMPGQEKRKGKGIVPLLMGASRKTFSRRFDAVVMLEKEKDGSRVFAVASQGVYGTGLRGIQGVESVPADIRGLWSRIQGGGKEEEKPKGFTKPPAKPTTASFTAKKK